MTMQPQCNRQAFHFWPSDAPQHGPTSRSKMMVSLVTETVLMAPWLSVHILPVGRRVQFVRYSQDSLASLQKVCGPYPDPAIELGGSPQIINHT